MVCSGLNVDVPRSRLKGHIDFRAGAVNELPIVVPDLHNKGEHDLCSIHEQNAGAR